MMLLPDMIEKMIASGHYHWLFSAVKGMRNGIIYGVKVRFPHALVMQFLFGKGTLLDKFCAILRATFQHARNLGVLAFCYKLIANILEKIQGRKLQWHTFASAFITAYYVFGSSDGVNMQINLYMLSRVSIGLARLSYEKGFFGKLKRPVYPWFAATVWGTALWLFQYHKWVLQPSLQHSMTFMFLDSDRFRNVEELVFVNKLDDAGKS